MLDIDQGLSAGDAQVRAFREFNRYFTQRIGMLTDRYVGQARPPAEARLLFEVRAGGSVRDIRARLDLDSGYLSRTLTSLERQGLVRLVPDPADGRARLVELTPAGRIELEDQDRRGDAAVEGILRDLDGHDRAAMVAAMKRIQRLLAKASTRIQAVDPGSADARRCLNAYAAELEVGFPGGFNRADLVTSREVSGAHGVFLVAYQAGRAVGCGAVRTIAPGVGEVRHLWVDASARRLGLGRRLLAELETCTSRLGHHTLRLATHRALVESQSLYDRTGYVRIEAYTSDPNAHLCYEKPIRARRQTP